MNPNSKMPHSKFKRNSETLGHGIGKCPCRQIVAFSLERDHQIKPRLHNKFCDKALEINQIKHPKRSMTLREAQQQEVNRFK